MQIYRLHDNGILNLDWGGVAGYLRHNDVAVFFLAAGQNFHQFFGG